MYIYIYIERERKRERKRDRERERGRRLRTRDRHLRDHRGCSVAFANGISLVGGMIKRIVTCTVDFQWSCPTDRQRRFPMELQFCDFKRVILQYYYYYYYY